MKKLSRRPAVIDTGDRKAMEEFFTKGGQVLLPLLELVESTEGAIDEVIDVVGRMTIETLLNLSAEEVAGPKVQGRQSDRDIYWYGRQQGEVVLSDQKVKVQKPRLRRRGVGAGGEVSIPVYERLREGSNAAHVLRVMMRGVSTRNYEGMLRDMAETTGVSKSSVSREWIEASAEQLEALQSRRLDAWDLLVVYVDGLVFADHHVLAAVGVDAGGEKHVLGIAPGSSENYHVAKDLLHSLIDRGLDPDRPRLFVIDGSKALRKAVLELFGPDTPIQRCRIHKLRNVVERLPKGGARPDEERDAGRVATGREGGEGQAGDTGFLARTSGPPRCRQQPPRGHGRDVHRQPPGAPLGTPPLPGHDERHRESQWGRPAQNGPGDPVARLRHDPPMDCGEPPRVRAGLPQDHGLQGPLAPEGKARRTRPGAGRQPFGTQSPCARREGRVKL